MNTKAMNHMFSKILLTFTFFVSTTANGASFADSTRFLKIGQKVPDIDVYYSNYDNKKVNFSALRGKCVILDLWSVTCSSCIYAMPKMNALQDKFKDNLQILLVTADDKERVEKLKLRAKNVRLNKIPSLVNAGQLAGMFKHFSFPTYIWIDPGGYVRYITNAEEITEEKIRGFTLGKALNLKEKKDIRLNSENPFLVEWYPYDRDVAFYSYLKPKNQEYFATVGSGLRRDKDGFIRKASHPITTIAGLYPFVFGFEYFSTGFAKNRLVEEYPDGHHTDTANVSPDSIKFYTFDFMTNKKIPDSQVKLYLKNLFDTYFNVSSSLQKRIIKVFVFKRYPGRNEYQSKGNEKKNTFDNNVFNMQNGKWVSFWNRIKLEEKPYEIIDETGINSEERIDLSINLDLGNIQILNQYLNKCGLYVEEQERKLDCIVLKYNQ